MKTPDPEVNQDGETAYCQGIESSPSSTDSLPQDLNMRCVGLGWKKSTRRR